MYSSDTQTVTTPIPSESKAIANKNSHATFIWLALILLSAIAAYLGEFSDSTKDVLIPILLILIIKAQLIIDYFMGLKSVKLFWRLSMSAFSIVISIIIWAVL